MRTAWSRRRFGPLAGTAGLEFALVAPVMTTLLLGVIEITNAIRMQAKLNIFAGQLTEMVAGQAAVVSGAAASQSDETGVLSDICAGAALSMVPYDISKLSANIASITNTATKNGTAPVQDWESDTSCGSVATHAGFAVMSNLANTPRSLLTLDGTPWNGTPGAANLVAGYSAIVVRVNYQYNSVLSLFLGKTSFLTAVAVARPRGNTTVSCTTTPINSANPVACPVNN